MVEFYMELSAINRAIPPSFLGVTVQGGINEKM